MANSFACGLALFLSLISTTISAITNTAVLLFLYVHSISIPKPTHETRSFTLYRATVRHIRTHPVKHKFSYSVRCAYIDMDDVPSFFRRSERYHLSADKARELAGTDGKVYLLTNPVSVGYEQNPISVYYCFGNVGNDESDSIGRQELKTCIAEVTNTPWGDRCTFTFSPDGSIPKPLHVSPFMDMNSTWQFKTVSPGESLRLIITASHPVHGEYFTASLIGQKEQKLLDPDWFFWLMPQKVAFGIYWQALLLWWKGVKLFVHPKYTVGKHYQDEVVNRIEEKSVVRSRRLCSSQDVHAARSGCIIGWTDAKAWPWN